MTRQVALLKAEQESVDKLKAEYDQLLASWQNEVEAFEELKAKELATIEEAKKRRTQEQRVIERQVKAMQQVVSKKDKEDIDAARKENLKLHSLPQQLPEENLHRVLVLRLKAV